MRSFTKQLQNATAHVTLTDEERARMHERLCEYMAYRPIRTTPTTKHGVELLATATRMVRTASFAIGSRYVTGTLLIASIVSTSMYGVTSAATHALPGDMLYPIKINVNEGVRGALLMDSKKRAAWEQERAERRIEEAGQLALQGRLDDEQQDKVTKLLTEHTNAVVETARELEHSNPILAIEVSTELKQSLDTHEAVLARIVVETADAGGVAEPARSLVEHVHSIAVEAGDVREVIAQQLTDTDPTLLTTITSEDQLLTSTSSVDTASTGAAETQDMLREDIVRAYERAMTLQQQAGDEIMTLDPMSELAGQAHEHLAQGTTLFEAGVAAQTASDTRTAYNAFRTAGDMFQNLVQVLKASNVFAITILPSSVQSLEGTSTKTATTSIYAPETVDTLHNEVADSIRTTQQLAGNEPLDDTQATKARDLIKDATAHLLRGEVALVLDDYTEAHTRLETARAYVTQARSQLMASTTPDIASGAIGESSPENFLGKIMTVEEVYASGTQTYRGVLPTQECVTIAAAVAYATTSTSSYVLTLTTTKQPESTCGGPVWFEVATTTPYITPLSVVIVDGGEVPFRIVHVTATTTSSVTP